MTLTKTLFVFSLFVLFACNNNSAEKPEELKPSTSTVNTISKAQFLIWKKQWRVHGAGYMDTSRLTFFNVQDVDLSEILNNNPDSTRFYIGLDSLTTDTYYPHFMLLGMKNGHEDRSMIVDYSTTCPPQCPPVSVLD